MKSIKIIIAISILLAVQSTNIFAQSPPTASTGCISGNCVNGFGKFIFNNGYIYEGDFVNSVLQGQGTLTYTNIGVYTGKFANGLRSGQGKFSFANGEIYEGGWVNDKREGQGMLTFKSGETYVGQYANDKKNGKGKETLANGGGYEGDFVNDIREGQGIFKFIDGSVYSGQFANGKRNGIGNLYTKSTNTNQEGIWKDDVFVNATTAANQPMAEKEAAIDANLIAKKAEIILTIKNAQEKTTYKERLEAAKQALKLQNEVVQYLTDAVNGMELSQIAKSKYRQTIEKEKGSVLQLENLVKVTADAAKYDSNQEPTPSSTTTPIAAKNGTLDDCKKSILSEGCRNYLLQSTSADYLPQVKDAFVFEGKELVSNGFRAKLIEATGGIYSVEFSETASRPYQPADNLKWDESLKSVKKKYGEPLQIRVDANNSRATHIYKNFELVYFVNKLRGINFGRDITESEIAAEQNFNSRKADFSGNSNIAAAINAYNITLDNYNLTMAYYNKKIEQQNKQTSRAAQDLVRDWNSYKTSKAITDMRTMLQDLLNVHGSYLPLNMKAQVEETLKKLN